ncbi:DeoR/GlpR family DNA-binding transcription regulator [Glutamicibacter arilaitensis]|uniref:DeoR/GlpR family DNA-binding transcription regulator n=1 Tax=Glutamicibacter arilaitensis TaxID=256701 RepID=UPI0038508C09
MLRSSGLPPESRRDELTGYINRVHTARVEDMADAFGVSAMTIHRDLDVLASEGRIERIRGGARAITARLAERDVRLRRHLNAHTKRRLARTAAQLIEPGSVIALDDSTTVGALGPHLESRQPSTVITHSLALMNAVSAQPSIALVGLGGQYYAETDSFLGSVVVEQAQRLTADAVFVSTTAVKNQALLHPDAEAALTKRALLKTGGRKILIVDSSKFEGNGLYHVMGLDEFDDVVIDEQLTPDLLALLESLNLNIHLAVTSPKD